MAVEIRDVGQGLWLWRQPHWEWREGTDWEPEVTAKILRSGVEIVEVPISYRPRSFEEGKKIGVRDGVTALLTLARYRFWKPS